MLFTPPLSTATPTLATPRKHQSKNQMLDKKARRALEAAHVVGGPLLARLSAVDAGRRATLEATLGRISGAPLPALVGSAHCRVLGAAAAVAPALGCAVTELDELAFARGWPPVELVDDAVGDGATAVVRGHQFHLGTGGPDGVAAMVLSFARASGADFEVQFPLAEPLSATYVRVLLEGESEKGP